MGEVASSPRVARFGVFEVDLRAGELRKRGARVRLPEQPLQVLAALLEQPGQVVTREELRRRLWPGTVVDFDHGLNTAINRLRDALGDDADTPRFIETLPRRGYRFVYPVNGTATHAPEAEARRVEAEPAAGMRRGAAGMALVGVPVVLLTLLALDVGGVRERVVGWWGAAGITSIAVLPLKNLSGDPGQDYFSDGTTEALITELGKIAALRVLSYQSVSRYARTARPLPDLGRELGVDAFLVGAVLESGGKVRLTAALVRASPERQLWAESYEADARDVIAIQRQLAHDVASRIRVTVTAPERARLRTPPRVDPEAYEAYLLARAHMSNTPTPATFVKAKRYLDEAISRDAAYAPAHASLAQLYVDHRPLAQSHEDARRQARRWAEKAVQLDDGLAEGHMVLARSAQQDWDFGRAEREYLRAIELNASHAETRVWFAMFLYAMSRSDEAVAQARRAQELDPMATNVHTWAAGAYAAAGLVEEAIAAAERALELDPAYADASVVLARTHLRQGRHEEAIEVLLGALTHHRLPQLLGALAHAYGRAGRSEEARSVLDELKGPSGGERAAAKFALAWAYAGMGENDRAFAALEDAFQQRLGRMVWLNSDPLLDPLRSDPRFADLVRRVGLPAPPAPPVR